MHGGPAERSGKLSIGDRITAANGTSLVGLPLATSQSILRELKNQTEVTLSVVHCPPVTTAIVRSADTKFPLGFCVENGIICSLMRGGIAERGGIRVGHHILEVNGQSVVAMPHQKVIQILTEAVREVRIKTMPASTYRLLTGQEQPVFL
nr:PREDICTED: amyloid beta A4 precursor protein-binding family A member 3-like [Anolis carolinensis]|eukprot:XP_008123928.1 PREDICTED: amyloid beta A4 precursor protein-binding family A member 3-like [Anolis carolinensis]